MGSKQTRGGETKENKTLGQSKTRTSGPGASDLKIFILD